eukprot:scaffold11428_cov157-Amphora_coffeaeformis.AAC.1
MRRKESSIMAATSDGVERKRTSAPAATPQYFLERKGSTSRRSMEHFLSQFVAILFFAASVASASELVVAPGYHLVEVQRDDTPYAGNDGLLIHGGNHLHDPCNSTFVGERYTWGIGSAKGFIVVNDCQVVTCRKWTTTNGDHGGETVVYDILKDSDSNGDATHQAQAPSLEVQETSTCTCNYERKWQIDESQDASCFVSRSVLLVDKYDQTCALDGDLEGPVVSVACTDQPVYKTSILTNIPDPIDSGVGLGSFLGGLVLLLLALLCCCCVCVARRRRRRTADGTPQVQTSAVTATGDKEQLEEKATKGGWFSRRGKVSEKDESAPPIEEAPKMGLYRSSSVHSEGGSKIHWFRFIGGNKDQEAQEKDIEANKLAETKAQAKPRGFFSFKSNGSNTENTTKPVETTEAKSSHGFFSFKSSGNVAESTAQPAETTEAKSSLGFFSFRKKKGTEVLEEPPQGFTPHKVKNMDSSSETAKEQDKNNQIDKKKQKNESVVNETDEGVDLTCCGIGY